MSTVVVVFEFIFSHQKGFLIEIALFGGLLKNCPLPPFRDPAQRISAGRGPVADPEPAEPAGMHPGR